jgi:prepilin-type N-terminal cleavage/methylation domain-containing protein
MMRGRIAIAHRGRGFGRPSGFTLIEIMLAIAILGIVLLMLAESFHAVAGSKVQGESRIALDQAARSIVSQMSDELRGAVQTPFIQSHVLLLGQARMTGGEPMDTFMVSTLTPGHRRSIEGFGPEDTVVYLTAPNPDHPGWFLLERIQYSSLLAAPPLASNSAPLVLANNLLSLHIRYFNGDSWRESWDSTSLPPGQSLPLEVAIDLKMASGGGAPLSLSTAVSLPMAFQQW